MYGEGRTDEVTIFPSGWGVQEQILSHTATESLKLIKFQVNFMNNNINM